MKNLIILYLFFITFPIVLNAQSSKFDFDPMGVKEIDSGNIRIYYNFYQIDSTIKDNKKTYERFDIQCLEIGDNLSKYYSYVLYDNTIQAHKWREKNKSAQSIPGWYSTLTPSQSWSEYTRMIIIKDFFTSQLNEYIQMPFNLQDYHYSEDIFTLDWEISVDTLTIVEYLCQRAICHFRGRDFIAWFTPDIPINNGPWKFGGLPGLIMKLYDKDEKFVYECVKIEQQEYKVFMPNVSEYRKITLENRGKLFKFIKDIHEDYSKATGLLKADGTPRSFPSEYPYRPLELE